MLKLGERNATISREGSVLKVVCASIDESADTGTARKIRQKISSVYQFYNGKKIEVTVVIGEISML